MKLIKKMTAKCVTGLVLLSSSCMTFADDSKIFPTVDTKGRMGTGSSNLIGYLMDLVKDAGFATLATLLLITVFSGVYVFKEGMDDYRETKKLGNAITTWFVGGVSIVVILGLIIYGADFLKSYVV